MHQEIRDRLGQIAAEGGRAHLLDALERLADLTEDMDDRDTLTVGEIREVVAVGLGLEDIVRG